MARSPWSRAWCEVPRGCVRDDSDAATGYGRAGCVSGTWLGASGPFHLPHSHPHGRHRHQPPVGEEAGGQRVSRARARRLRGGPGPELADGRQVCLERGLTVCSSSPRKKPAAGRSRGALSRGHLSTAGRRAGVWTCCPWATLPPHQVLPGTRATRPQCV